MKRKISITVSDGLLAQVDRLAGPENSRSAFIVNILQRYIDDRRRASEHTRDLAKINRAAVHLNREAVDVLEYQTGKIETSEGLKPQQRFSGRRRTRDGR